MHHDVGDVAVNEHLAWIKTGDLVAAPDCRSNIPMYLGVCCLTSPVKNRDARAPSARPRRGCEKQVFKGFAMRSIVLPW